MAYPEQPSYVRIGSSWKTVEQAFIYKSGAWKRINQAYVRQGGAWKRVYAYDAIAPTIVRFELSGTVSGGTYGNTKTTASYVLEFSETMASWNNAMVTFSSNPGTAWSISSVTTSDNKTYAINISMSGTQTSGTVRLSVLPTGATDESGINPWTGSAYLSQAFLIDVTKPTVDEFASASASTATTVVFTLRFSEPVTGLVSGEFTIGGTSTGWALSSFTGSGSLYTITLVESSANSTTNGTLTLSIPANSTSDSIGNLGPASTATSTAFTVVRTPVTPTITASSTNLTLHDRRVNYTVTVPAGSTTITNVYVYLYDSNDNYTGTYDNIDVTDTSAAFTTSENFNVGRNPGTKYYVRAQTYNVFGYYSNISARAETTTGSDLTPPVLAAPTLTAVGAGTDPGSPGVANPTRSISYSFATPSSYLTTEVGSVTVYCVKVSDGVQAGTTSHAIGAGWTGTALTGTFTGLAYNVAYKVYARSTDIYGGTNSTADSASTNATTVNIQTGYTNYENNVNYRPRYNMSGTAAAALDVGNELVYGADDNDNSGYVTRGDGGWSFWQGNPTGIDWLYYASGTSLVSVTLWSAAVRTGRAQFVWVQYQRADGTWLGSAGTDPVFGNSTITQFTTPAGSMGSGDVVDVSIGTDTSFTWRIVFSKVSYNGFYINGSTTNLGTTLRTVLVETYPSFTVYSRTPHYW